jgi:hypothetical protein
MHTLTGIQKSTVRNSKSIDLEPNTQLHTFVKLTQFSRNSFLFIISQINTEILYFINRSSKISTLKAIY